MHRACWSSGKNGSSDVRMSALVVVQQEVDPVGVVERALLGRDLVDALRVSERLLAERARSASGEPGSSCVERPLQQLAGDALERVAAGRAALDEVVGELERRAAA